MRRVTRIAIIAALFPGARVIRERVFGWTKSLVAVRAQRNGISDE